MRRILRAHCAHSPRPKHFVVKREIRVRPARQIISASRMTHLWRKFLAGMTVRLFRHAVRRLHFAVRPGFAADGRITRIGRTFAEFSYARA